MELKLPDGISFKQLDGVECYMATEEETVLANIEHSIKRNLPELEFLPEFGKSKGNEPIAIAGGGPSITYTVDELRNFKRVIAAGSSLDWLIEHGIRPTYCIILDPDIAAANYIKHPDPLCTYLVASCCHPKVFDLLEKYPVIRWHSMGPDEKWFEKVFKNAGYEDIARKPVIGGGPTCGLRAVSLVMCLGFRNIHFFGLDSNLDLNTGAHHAYDFVDPENEFLGDIVPLRLGHQTNGRLFYVAKYMLAQLYSFQELVNRYGHHFDITVHGDSAIYEWMRLRKLAIKEKLKECAEETIKAA